MDGRYNDDEQNNGNEQLEYDDKIPPKIHFIWVGGDIPEKYLRTIQQIAGAAKQSDFELNLWVEYENNYENTSTAANISISNLKIRKVNELANNMIDDDFYKGNIRNLEQEAEDEMANEDDNKEKASLTKEDDTHNKYEKFWTTVNNEMVGYKNLATAADLLRLEILRQEGGYYFDTDTLFVEGLKKFERESVSWGIKIHADLTYDLLPGGEGLYSVNYKNMNNNVIGALPNNFIIKDTIDIALSRYQSYATTQLSPPVKKQGHQITELDAKRFPYSQAPRHMDPKYHYTLQVGPDALLKALKLNCLVGTLDDLKTLSICGLGEVSALTDKIPKKVAGAEVLTPCDKTWIMNPEVKAEKKKQQHAFSTGNEIPILTPSRRQPGIFDKSAMKEKEKDAEPGTKLNPKKGS